MKVTLLQTKEVLRLVFGLLLASLFIYWLLVGVSAPFKATDSAGNTILAGSTEDTIPPKIAQITLTNDRQFTANVTDPDGSGISRVEYVIYIPPGINLCTNSNGHGLFDGTNPFFSGNLPTYTYISGQATELLLPGERACVRAYDNAVDTQENQPYSGNVRYKQSPAMPYELAIESITSSTGDGSYGAGETIEIEVKFSRKVRINVDAGGPSLTLNTGGTTKATYDRIIDQENLFFTYQVATGDNASDLDVTALELGHAVLTAKRAGNVPLTFAIPADHSLADTKNLVIDTITPTITVTLSDDQSAPKQTITVSAESPDTDLDPNSWAYKLIASDATCDLMTMTDGTTTSGSSTTLNQESDNNHKVCFSVTDQADNTAYRASGVISGIDTTPPTIDVSAVTNNQVSATVSDNLDFKYTTIPSADSCTAAPLTTFQDYTTGTPIPLPQGTKACFKATDAAANVLVVASAVAALQIQPDITPPTITVTPSGDDATAKQTITVSAESPDTDLDSHSWAYKLIASDATCDLMTMTDGTTTSGSSTTLNQESHNNHKVCFSVTDQADNTAYRASGVISGIDTTPPVITVSPLSSNNQVSAAATDILAPAPSLSSQILASGDCDANTAGSFITYTAGDLLTLDPGQKACFKATDAAANTAYAVSDVGADITPPVITVTPSGDDATAKQTITVSASSTDTDRDSTSWLSKIITSDAACDATTMADATSTDTMVILDQESHNNHKVCFSVTDQADNIAYQASGVISGIDTTPPTIDVSAVTNNQVSATVSDLDNDPDFEYTTIPSTNPCTAPLTTFQPYTTGTPILLPQNTKACFKATDNAGNVLVVASVVASPQPPPQPELELQPPDTTPPDTTPPVITVSPLSSSNQVSATATDILAPAPSLSSQILASGDCDANTADNFSPYTAGDLLTLDPGQKACFKATDAAANTAYAVSAVGVDDPAPIVTVSAGSVANSFKASDDQTATATTWSHAFISQSSTCGGSIGFPTGVSYTEGQDLSYTDAHNNRKVCFRSTDGNNKRGYAASAVIDTDTTAPTITVSPLSSNNQVSATVSDIPDNDPSLSSQILASNFLCYAATAHLFTTYTAGDLLTLDPGQKACFKATDNAANTAYAVSDVGADITPPVITVTPSGDDATAKQTITVSASSTDTDRDSTSWLSKIITSDAACDATTMADATSTDTMVILDQESHNNHKVCFSVTDQADNTAYQASGVISGIDTTPPTIDVSAVTNNQVSATVSDILGNDPDFEYTTIPSTDPCTAFLTTFQPYTTGTPILLPQNTKACFKATDAADNVLVVASVVASPQPPPQPELELQPPDTAPPIAPVITVSPLSSNNQVSAAATDILAPAPSLSSQILASGDCDANTADNFSPYTAGDLLTLDPGQKACFKATDAAANTAYAVSDVGVDDPAPIVTVSAGSVANSFTASDDQTATTTTWSHAFISQSSTCGGSIGFLTGVSYTEGQDLSYTDAHNNRKVCFRSTASNNKRGYAASAVIDTDTTAPTITVSPLSSNNQVSATVSDIPDNDPSLSSQILASNFLCYAATAHLFTTYTAGDLLTLDPGQKACFKLQIMLLTLPMLFRMLVQTLPLQ